MNIAKRALTIALRHPIYLVIYIGFLSVMGVVLMGEVDGGVQASETAGTEGARARIAWIDRDDSAVSRGVEEALAQTDELVLCEDEKAALQDALACDRVDAVFIAPAGFGDDLIDSARSGRELPALEVAAGSNMQATALASQRASRMASLVASQAAIDPRADVEQILANVRDLADLDANVEVIEATQEDTAASRLAFYLTFSSYTVTSSVVVIAGVVLAAMSKPEMRHRQLASAVSSWRSGIESIAGCAALTLGVCAWVAAVGIATSGAAASFAQLAPQICLALISFLAFSLVPLSLAYALTQCGLREEALNAIANLGGMVMSFLGGAWVPLSLMEPGVQAAARLSPTFWMHDAVTRSLEAPSMTPQLIGAVGIDLGIIALFAAAITSAGLVASRLRVREA